MPVLGHRGALPSVGNVTEILRPDARLERCTLAKNSPLLPSSASKPVAEKQLLRLSITIFCCVGWDTHSTCTWVEEAPRSRGWRLPRRPRLFACSRTQGEPGRFLADTSLASLKKVSPVRVRGSLVSAAGIHRLGQVISGSSASDLHAPGACSAGRCCLQRCFCICADAESDRAADMRSPWALCRAC